MSDTVQISTQTTVMQTVIVTAAAHSILVQVDRLAAGLVMAERERAAAERALVELDVDLIDEHHEFVNSYKAADQRVTYYLDKYNELTDDLVEVYRDGLPT
ncbi:hypothetical protein KHQ84_gp196 [Rhodococcus phage Finch]|uniref:Uncharacterized protein n=1 Tax=Rhodococcus phage Finch TaxID=2094144 RepID=A0A2P1JXU0_9CAUD|nr:hypothetical protein KHQ84_gp196 [Rhodococcus phage Finch]AVO25120.1 hypothetical protein SEA_FINCH_196 [Rhodococcus phage Finch]